jgi:hypothetical protein
LDCLDSQNGENKLLLNVHNYLGLPIDHASYHRNFEFLIKGCENLNTHVVTSENEIMIFFKRVIVSCDTLLTANFNDFLLE